MNKSTLSHFLRLKFAGLLLLLYLTSSVNTYSQPESFRFMPGVYGALAYNLHSGTFSTYDGILNCGYFKDASSPGFMFGNLFDIPISYPFSLSLRVNFYKADGDFESENANPQRISLEDGTLVNLETMQKLTTVLDYFQFEAIGKYHFLENYYAGLGPVFGITSRATYSQDEEILSPSGVKYLNGSTSQRLFAGNFSDESNNTAVENRIALHFVLGADFKLSDLIYLNPEIGFNYALTNVISPSDWLVHNLHAGLGVKFMLGKTERIIIEPEPRPKDEEPKPSPILSLLARKIDNRGNLGGAAEINIIEHEASDIVPLLPYVFFESNSSSLPQRYHKLNLAQADLFDESELKDSVIGVYHHVLNVIGERMQIFNEAKIDVTGCVEPFDDTSGTSELASKRAQTVKDYLVNVWKINPERIRLNSRELPQQVSNRQDADGRQENRRVEIFSTERSILAPVRIYSGRFEYKPEKVALQPTIVNLKEAQNWSVSVESSNNKLFSDFGTGLPPSNVEWDYFSAAFAGLARSNKLDNVNSTLSIVDNSGGNYSASVNIPVRYKKSSLNLREKISGDSLLERYNLIFFDFDKPEISEFNKSVFKTILQRIRTNSSVSITGFTDRLGSSQYNLELSQRRASAMEKSVRERVVPEVITSRGVGETLIYNNDLPEGRFYNRTVIIEIATPLSE